jgi:hypothetical protein
MRLFRKRMPVFFMGGVLLFLAVLFFLSYTELPAREGSAASSAGAAPAEVSSPLDRNTLQKIINGRGFPTRKTRPWWLIGIDNMGRFEEKDRVFVSP